MAKLKYLDEKGQEQIIDLVAFAGGTTGGGDKAGKVISESPLSGTPYTQTITALAATRQRLTFDPPIKGAKIQIRHGSVTSADLDNAALICFDATTTVIADDWLDETGIAPRECVKPEDGVQEFYFNGATVSYVDLIAVGTTPDLDATVVGIV